MQSDASHLRHGSLNGRREPGGLGELGLPAHHGRVLQRLLLLLLVLLLLLGPEVEAVRHRGLPLLRHLHHAGAVAAAARHAAGGGGGGGGGGVGVEEGDQPMAARITQIVIARIQLNNKVVDRVTGRL